MVDAALSEAINSGALRPPEQWQDMAASPQLQQRLAQLPPAAPADASGQPDFVRRSALLPMQFERDGRPFTFLGCNMWYAPNMAATAAGRARLTRELDRVQMLGLKGIRLMAMSEGAAVHRWRATPASQPAPGVFDAAVEEGLDFVMAELGKRELVGVLCLNNFWTWSGGMAQYVAWATGKEAPLLSPNTKDFEWDAHAQLASSFYGVPPPPEGSTARALLSPSSDSPPTRLAPAVCAQTIARRRGYGSWRSCGWSAGATCTPGSCTATTPR